MVKYLTSEEVAELLRCSVRTVYRNLFSGKLKAVKVLGEWRFPEDQFYLKEEG